MAEYIDREAVLETLMYAMCGTGYQTIAMREVRYIPPADVAPVVHGRWVMDGEDHCHCSECKGGRNIRTQIGWAFCPNCGAKMNKEES